MAAARERTLLTAKTLAEFGETPESLAAIEEGMNAYLASLPLLDLPDLDCEQFIAEAYERWEASRA